MYRTLHTIAMAAVLAHMVLGCCVHHAHGEHSALGPSAAGREECSRDDSAGRPHAHHDGCGSHEQGSGHEECGGRDCFFVKPDGNNSSDDLIAWVDVAFFDPPAVGGVDLRLPLPLAHGPLFWPGIRLHLVNQVLLV